MSAEPGRPAPTETAAAVPVTGARPGRCGTVATDRPTVSFELYPPRDLDAAPRLWETVRAIEQTRPDFVSVTYGASGRTRTTSRALVSRLLRETNLNPIAHLTCVGTSRDEVATIVREFLDEGVRAFLALRGDPPTDTDTWAAHPDGIATAGGLVQLLREIEAQRVATSPAQAVRASVHPLSVAVAAFPRGNHATGGTRAQDVAALLDKQAAGADFAITQVFFVADDYLALVADARAAGVTIPIVPGIVPTTDPARLVRTSELTGVPVPRELLALLDGADDEAERHRLGTRWGVDLVDRVLDGGAPGVHLYTFNRSEAAIDLLDGAGLLSRPPTPTAHQQGHQ
jgi:methylenetetrahydrofolate reductase (NADPH)